MIIPFFYYTHSGTLILLAFGAQFFGNFYLNSPSGIDKYI